VANGRRYSGIAVVDKLPSKMEVQITYAPSDPTINKLSEPALESADHFWSDIVVVRLCRYHTQPNNGSIQLVLGIA
jgi:hypothetical protein